MAKMVKETIFFGKKDVYCEIEEIVEEWFGTDKYALCATLKDTGGVLYDNTKLLSKKNIWSDNYDVVNISDCPNILFDMNKMLRSRRRLQKLLNGNWLVGKDEIEYEKGNEIKRDEAINDSCAKQLTLNTIPEDSICIRNMFYFDALTEFVDNWVNNTENIAIKSILVLQGFVFQFKVVPPAVLLNGEYASQAVCLSKKEFKSIRKGQDSTSLKAFQSKENCVYKMLLKNFKKKL
ncbi:MAG: hypothetical protein Q4F29_06460 [Lachnospiraceae bacterium]|nr:hypothetical protein [Lachnospiraceae bacterium]